jgi:DNA-binding NarL/FixJ family response regulator
MPIQDKPPIRILLADDQEVIALGLRKVFESREDIELVAVANNFNDTVSLCKTYRPDLILFECCLQEGHCIERIPEIFNLCPSCKILILTSCLNQERHLTALRYGALGVFSFNHPIEMLIKAIHKVHAGGVWLTSALSMEILRVFNNSESQDNHHALPTGNSLTVRELSIAQLAAQGMQAKQIAEKLYLSEKTVRNLLVIVYSKFGVHSHLELVLNAAQLGLLKSGT